MFSLSRHSGAIVIELDDVPCFGEMRLEHLRAQLVRLAREKKRLIIDCSQVRYFGATFLGLLLTVNRHAEEIILCDLPQYADEVLQVTGLEGFWPVHPTVEAALLADAPPTIIECGS